MYVDNVQVNVSCHDSQPPTTFIVHPTAALFVRCSVEVGVKCHWNKPFSVRRSTHTDRTEKKQQFELSVPLGVISHKLYTGTSMAPRGPRRSTLCSYRVFSMPLTYTAEHFWFVQIPDGYALYQPLLAQKRTGETLRANREKLAAKHVAEPVTPTPDYEFKSICIMFHHGATKFEAQITLRFEETRDTANKETYD